MKTQWQRIGWACAVVGVMATTWPATSAQSSAASGAQASRVAAERALLGGRHDEVERLAANATDPVLVTLRAKALIARGEYAKAESLLAGAAAADPAGDAALELGLLQLYLGRRSEGRRALQLILMADLRAAN